MIVTGAALSLSNNLLRPGAEPADAGTSFHPTIERNLAMTHNDPHNRAEVQA